MDRTSNPSPESCGPVLDELEDQLARHHTVVSLNEVTEPRAGRALDWLLSVRAAEGYWGYRSAAVTGLACLGVAIWRPQTAQRDLAQPRSWLLEQIAGDHWETPWDSAVALRAILLISGDHDDRAEAALRAVLELDPNDAAWATKAHHAAQILHALAAADCDPSLRRRWAETVLAGLDPSCGPYVVGQGVQALIATGAVDAGALGVHLEYLTHYLRSTVVSTSAFLDHAASLQALAATGGHDAIVGETLDELFSDAHRSDGSWYHEPWYTAWALVAMAEAQSARRVIVEAPAFRRAFARARSRVTALEENAAEMDRREIKERRRIFVATASLVIMMELVGVVLWRWDESNPVFSSGILIGALIGALGLAWGILRGRLFRRSSAGSGDRISRGAS